MTFPNYRWKNVRYLGVAQDSGDELTFIVEMDYEGRKQRLVRSVIQSKFPEGGHPPRVRIKIAPAVLFQDPVSRKRENNAAEKASRRRKNSDNTASTVKNQDLNIQGDLEPFSVD